MLGFRLSVTLIYFLGKALEFFLLCTAWNEGVTICLVWLLQMYYDCLNVFVTVLVCIEINNLGYIRKQTQSGPDIKICYSTDIMQMHSVQAVVLHCNGSRASPAKCSSINESINNVLLKKYFSALVLEALLWSKTELGQPVHCWSQYYLWRFLLGTKRGVWLVITFSNVLSSMSSRDWISFVKCPAPNTNYHLCLTSPLVRT